MKFKYVKSVFFIYLLSASVAYGCEKENRFANEELSSIGEFYASGATLSIQKLAKDFEVLSKLVTSLDGCLLREKTTSYSDNYADLYMLLTDLELLVEYSEEEGFVDPVLMRSFLEGYKRYKGKWKVK